MKRIVLHLLLLAFGMGATVSSASNVMAQDDESTTTRVTAEDVLATLQLYREPARQLDLVETSIEKLDEFKDDIDRSTELTAAEKSRWTRAVNRRIGYLEDALFRLERVEANQPSDRYEQSSSQQPQGQNVPTGWRQTRAWQGGGALPGGSWQGSQFQEVWGVTHQSNPVVMQQTSPQSSSGMLMQDGTQQPLNEEQMNQIFNELMIPNSTIGGLQLFDRPMMPFETMQPNQTSSQFGLPSTGARAMTGGGIMVGGRSSSSSSGSTRSSGFQSPFGCR